jgi:hypothetical protein
MNIRTQVSPFLLVTNDVNVSSLRVRANLLIHIASLGKNIIFQKQCVILCPLFAQSFLVTEVNYNFQGSPRGNCLTNWHFVKTFSKYYRTLWSSGYHSSFVFWRSRVEISDWRQVILTDFLLFSSFPPGKFWDCSINWATTAYFCILSISLFINHPVIRLYIV